MLAWRLQEKAFGGHDAFGVIRGGPFRASVALDQYGLYRDHQLKAILPIVRYRSLGANSRWWLPVFVTSKMLLLIGGEPDLE